MASISDRVGDLGEYLREQRENARLSVRQLASLAGVSNPYLSQVERGLRRPSAEVLQQIARGLRISAEALYVRAGILDEDGRPDVEVAVGSDPHLTDRQRRVLLDIYASFRAENARLREAEDLVSGVVDADDPEPAVRPARAARSRAAKTAPPSSAGRTPAKTARARKRATPAREPEQAVSPSADTTEQAAPRKRVARKRATKSTRTATPTDTTPTTESTD